MKGFLSPSTNKRVIAPLDLRTVRGRMTGKNVSNILIDVLKSDQLRKNRGTPEEKGDLDYLDSSENLMTSDHPPYRALGFDGCKVNTGIHNGVNVNLENETGVSFFKIHCVPHRVNILNRRLLTSKNMAFRCEGFVSTMKVIDEAFNLIKYSQVNNSIFHSLQELMGLKAYQVIRIPNSRFEYAYNQALRCKVRTPEIIDTLIQIVNKEKNQKKKAEISGILSRFLTPQFHYRLDIIVDFLKPLRYLSKLTQTRDALASEIYNQIRITRSNLRNMKADGENFFNC